MQQVKFAELDDGLVSRGRSASSQHFQNGANSDSDENNEDVPYDQRESESDSDEQGATARRDQVNSIR